ncbi:MAG: DEAD/DEAH box helicase [Acidobacteriota bacterium]
MTVLKLSKYTNDDHCLVDEGDAEFLKRKIGPDVSLDFTGVTYVSPAFLDILLEGETPESIGDRVIGLSELVDQAMAAWVDRKSQPVKVIERPRTRPKVKIPQRSPLPSPFERPPSTDDRFTPTRLVRRLRNALRGYIESAYPLSDPLLVRSRRILLETDANEHLLAQEPFIETTPRYATSPHSYGNLGLPDHIGKLFERLAHRHSESSSPSDERFVLFNTMYGHQERAFRAFLSADRDIIVATGTGSGKTECFLVPMLGSLYDEAYSRPDSFALPAVRALILYPMNALVNDQLARLRLLFGDIAVANEFRQVGSRRFPRFGMYTGRTPYPGPRNATKDSERVAPLLEYYLNLEPEIEKRLQQMGRYPAKDLRAFYAKQEERRGVYQSGEKAGKEYTKHNWERRLHTSPEDRELLTRQEMVHGVGTFPGHSPDILVTNYSMLEYMLMRPFERPIFDETRHWLQQKGSRLILVLDEAHMYRGAKGAEVAFLIRRLRARLGIHNQPDKLSVIATSASLGSEANALENNKKFTADLTGKTPANFDSIIGTRAVPEPAGPASTVEADLFSSLDLEAINQASTGDDLCRALSPLFTFYNLPCNSSDESEVLNNLYQALTNRPYVNQLIQAAAGSARDLNSLAELVFSGHPRARRALEVLLTLGTLARLKPDTPGLIPTRVHAMFRGVHGLYACINPVCSGRQAGPGESAVVGKLFSYPQSRCDACGTRVFEVASCRSCGAPYIIAYAESSLLARLNFLWGETEGNLERIELLPSTPRYSDRTEEIQVHLRTGYINAQIQSDDGDVRSMYFWLNTDGGRQASFERCAMCQPIPSARARILDFRTRGEQPFTALIEAQFAEQPPQKLDPRLPNHGRKVLVFSDGRQKAARLAPALEHSHARDLFRQVICLATHELRTQENQTGMQWLYPAVAWLCGNRGYNLFPSADEVEFHNQLRRVKGKSLPEAIRLANRGGLRPTRSFAQALFSELTDRYYSLPSLALGTVEENPDMDYVFDDFPITDIEPEATKVIFRAWIRLHLERRSFKPDGAEIRELGEGWAGPLGINAEKISQILPNRFDEYLKQLLGNDEAFTQVSSWFQCLVRNSDLLDFEGDLYYLRPLGLSINLRLDGAWFRCVDCGRIHPEALGDLCPGCLGRLVEAEAEYLNARTGFYRDQVVRAFDPLHLDPFGLSAAEHSAQLTGQPDESAFNKVEEYELRFQDITLDGKPPIDVLSCTTTMEVGIDIGALCGVGLRNVPPHVANYQQRAGRAGRRGRSIASVITYAHGTSHDAQFFEHPEAIISGIVRPPIVYVENQQVLERHIFAYVVQRFFHEQVPTDTGSSAYQLFESLGTVEQFLSEIYPCSLLRMEAWLTRNEYLLKDELRYWVPTFSYGLNENILGVTETINTSITNLCRRLRSVLPVSEYENRDQIEGLAREALARRLEENLLEALIGHAVLPRYAFPTDVVSFWVSKPHKPGGPRERRVFDYEPQRDLQLALSEYAPGRSLTIDKWRFESAAVFSPYEPSPAPTLARRQPYTACRLCTFVSLDPAAASMALCPCCGSDQVVHTFFVTPAGFAPDINERWEVDNGQPITYAGVTDRARLEFQDPPENWQRELYNGRLKIWTGPRRLAVVNKGVGDRGFRICPDCGRSEPEFGPGFTKTTLTRGGLPVHHKHPLEQGTLCAGSADGPFYLGHRFPTDTLLFRMNVVDPVRLGMTTTPGLLSKAARMALCSLVEAISIAASKALQIDEGEISGWWAPVLGARTNEAQIYFYDLLPGGAGYARAVGEAIEDVLEATENLLSACDCAQSCYRCIRHYGNNFIHASLDRHLALSLLRHIRHGVTPIVKPDERATVLRGLAEVLQLRRVSIEHCRNINGVEIPLVFSLAEREVWVDVHHPLVDPALSPSNVAIAAKASFRELVELDAFTLVHDLPAAVSQIQLPEGCI